MRDLISRCTVPALAALILSTGALAQDKCQVAPVTVAAGEITQLVNTIADYARIICVPSQGSGGKCSVSCASELRIHTNIQNEFLVILMASAGVHMREAGLDRLDSLVFTDKNLRDSRSYRTITASRASELQAALAQKRIAYDELRRTIDHEFVEKRVEPE